MALLQPRLNLQVAQRQILTPGLMQMVSVLALNKLDLKEMINAEMVENPVLEEIDETVPLLDEVQGREARLENRLDSRLDSRVDNLSASAETETSAAKDPFDEVDFGSYFQEYLDPGYRTQREYEDIEQPSFENFLSQPTTLTDHLEWQLGALNLTPDQLDAANFIIGNLDDDGYLSTSVDDLVESFAPTAESRDEACAHIEAALTLIQSLDPVGVAARNLKECLGLQIRAQQAEFELVFLKQPQESEPISEAISEALNARNPRGEQIFQQRREAFAIAHQIVEHHLLLLQKRDSKEIARLMRRTYDEVQSAIDLIRTLDPRPGRRYNIVQTRLIEPDVAFVKRDDQWVVALNEEDLPMLRLSHRYRRLLSSDGTEKEVRDYVKERFRSAIQLMRNLAQRKSTILRTCEVIVRRQAEFLDQGLEALRPMMIKEVAEEIGVHPSTVSRAVANKYVHTPQGVYELRYFFSEGVNGPEGADTSLLVLKRMVRKLIEQEDPQKPFTDDHLAAQLQAQGIQVTRRTIAKYRDELHIPSTHQRRRRT